MKIIQRWAEDDFEAWWNSPKNYPTAKAACKAAWDARKELDAQIARDAASHNMASIVHAQNIAELIENQEE